MKVKIKPVTSYMVTREDGFCLGTFEKTSEWNGMIQLTASPGKTLIVSDPELDTWMGRIFGTESERAVTVVKATPGLFEEFNPT